MPQKRPAPAAPAAPAHPIRKGLVEAPTFEPTEAEFANPLRYILSVREQAEKFGICCIKPPPSWKPPFMLDLNKLKFPTRVQKINELLIRKVQRMRFMKLLTEFCDASGKPLSKIPDVSGKTLDLHLLYTLVGKRGGFEKASADKKWSDIAEHMNMHNTTTSHLAQVLKKHYQQLLLPYERVSAGLDPPPPPRATSAKPAADAAGAADAAEPMAVDAASGATGTADDAAAAAAAAVAAEPEQPMISSGGGLMAKRGLKYTLPAVGEVVKLSNPKGVERSNAEEEEVIAYECVRWSRSFDLAGHCSSYLPM